MPRSSLAVALLVAASGAACGISNPAGSAGESTATGAESDGASSTSSTQTSVTAGDGDGSATGDGDGAHPCVGARDHAPSIGLSILDPVDTDPAISTGGPDHLWAEPSPEDSGKLFVMLPGTGGPPVGYRQVLQNAAAGGYRALGLAYPNASALKDLCPVGSALDCKELARIEILTGTDTSTVVDVDRANSIENRLIRALETLGWADLLDAGEPRWADIAVAGHSQGGGHAAMIARLHDVHRVTLFASTEPAQWTTTAHITPAEKYFGFVHVDDPEGQFFLNSWENLGLPGEPTSVDGAALSFGDSHRLTTAVTPAGDNPHGSPVTDPSTPQDGEQPLYRDVWCLLIGP